MVVQKYPCGYLQDLLACERQTFREEESLRLSDRNSILMTQNLSGIRLVCSLRGRRLKGKGKGRKREF